LPGLIVAGLLAIPYIDKPGQGTGLWFSRHRLWPNIVFGLFVLAMTLLIILGTFFRGADWKFVTPW